MSKIIKSDKVVMVDVDSTLCFDIADVSAEYAASEIPTPVICFGQTIEIYPHWDQVQLVQKFRRRGYTVIVWSHSGADWAEAVCKALDMDDLVSLYLAKPKFYIDDLAASTWIGERVYREFEE